MTYNWQQKDWPSFTYDLSKVEDILYAISEKSGRINGLLAGLLKPVQTEIMIDIMVAEAIKTSAIEGEYLSRNDVLSSIKSRLGVKSEPIQIPDKRAEGIAELMVDVRNGYMEEFTEEKLFAWHKMIMKGSKGITPGAWRKQIAPMQIISGAIGREIIHFEAPPSSDVPTQMTEFMKWFNVTGPKGSKTISKPVVRSAIAHIYFESIHPFEDGNGRVGRAISEKALMQGWERPILFSISQTIEANKQAYYQALKDAQRTNEITAWIEYFAEMTLEAQSRSELQIDFTLKKTQFFDVFKNQLNDRQVKVVNKMLDAGVEGFEGGMTAKKYMSISRASKATATRDLQDMVTKGALVPIGGGRSTSYKINLD